MAAVDRFRAVHELHRNGLSAIYAIHSSQGDEHILKVTEPSSEVLDPEEIKVVVARLVEQAQTQQEVVASVPADRQAHWAPIHECDVEDGQAYYTTDKYPLCCQDLIQGRITVNPVMLHGICAAVVAGLHELDEACGRPHGNLKPSNILIRTASTTRLTANDVVLTDPLASSVCDESRHRVADQHDLGRLIVQLVTHQDVPSRDSMPLSPSGAWGCLGRCSSGWLSLCNQLLYQDHTDGPIPLDELVQRVGSLRPNRHRKRNWALGILAGLAVAAMILIFHEPTPDPEPVVWTVGDEHAWSTLCREYEVWFALLSKNFDQKRRANYNRDPSLKPIVMVIDHARDSGNELDPKIIAEAPNFRQDRRLLQVTNHVKSDACKQQTIIALRAINKVKHHLDHLGDDDSAWAPLVRMQRLIDTLEQRQWHNPTRVLRALRFTQRLSDEAPLVDKIDAIDEFFDFELTLKQIEEHTQELQHLSDYIRSNGDPFFEEYDQYVREQLRSHRVGYPLPRTVSDMTLQLTILLDETRELKTLIDDYWLEGVDRSTFLRHRGFDIDPGQALSHGDIEKWKAAVQSPEFQKLDPKTDPRHPWSLTQANPMYRYPVEYDLLRKTARTLKDNSIDKLVVNEADGGAQEVSITDLLATIENRLIKLDQQPWNPLTRQDVEKQSGRILTSINRYQSHLNRELDQLDTSFEKYVDQLREQGHVVSSGSQALSAAWEKQRDELLQGSSAMEFARLRRNITKLKALLEQIDLAFAASLPELDRRRTWNTELEQQWLPTAREQAIQSLIDQIHWETTLRGPIETTRQMVGRAAAPFLQKHQSVSELLQDFNRIEDLLDAGYALKEHPVEGPTVSEIFVDGSHSSLLEDDSEIGRIVSPIIERVERIMAIREERQSSTLVETVIDSATRDIALAMEAWRQLGRVADWPAKRSDLDSEQRLLQRLHSIIERAPISPTRAARLKQAIKDGARERWLKYARTIQDEADIEYAFAAKDVFAIDDEALEQYPRLRFNLWIYSLGQPPALVSKPEQAEWITAKVEAAQNIIQGLDPETRSSAMELERDLRKLLDQSKNNPGVDPASLGPAVLEGWSGRALDNEARRYGFAWESPSGTRHDVHFERVDLADNSAIYLSTTEVSVQLFVDVVDAQDRWSQVVYHIGDENNQLELASPRGWQWVNESNLESGIITASRWYPRQSTPTNLDIIGPIYAEGLRLMPDTVLANYMRIKTGDQPSPKHPMQHISVKGVWWFAHLMGCRLPTAAEWQTAHRSNRQQTTNRRDQTWRLQQQYIQQALGRGGMNYPWPDDGIFYPDDILGLNVPDRGKAKVANGQDQWLWFAAVDQGQAAPFYHLEGNVAEFVYDDPKRFEEVATSGDDADRFSVLLNDPGLAVIGGSALSPPSLEVDRPYQIDPSDHTKGFSDVGFRLAFALPEPTLLMRLHELRKNYEYLDPMAN